MPARKKILVVEDDADLADFLVRTLESQNHEVVAAWNSAKALQEAQQIPDLILLDINVEGLSGLKILETIRTDPKTSGIPVVMCSSADSAGNKTKARALGADGFLAKPFKLDDFIATVQRILGSPPA